MLESEIAKGALLDWFSGLSPFCYFTFIYFLCQEWVPFTNTDKIPAMGSKQNSQGMKSSSWRGIEWVDKWRERSGWGNQVIDVDPHLKRQIRMSWRLATGCTLRTDLELGLSRDRWLACPRNLPDLIFYYVKSDTHSSSHLPNDPQFTTTGSRALLMIYPFTLTCSITKFQWLSDDVGTCFKPVLPCVLLHCTQ